jgi:rRNA-processing protein FCF1
MVKVILDSNFLFVPFQFQVDIFEELGKVLGKAEPVVLSTTLEELNSLRGRRSEKMRRQASAAIKLAERCRIVEVERGSDESFDDVVLRMAKKWKCLVATNDADLRRRLRESDMPVVFLRQKSHLEVDGNLPF